MKKVLLLFLIGAVVSCQSEEKKDVEKEGDLTAIEMDVCDCIEPSEADKENCAKAFPHGLPEDEMNMCNELDVEPVPIDSMSREEIDSARTEYENSTSLEIQQIEEEIENPISEDCMMFLEEYADEVKSFTDLVDRMAANPDDINLKVTYMSQSENLGSYSTNPQMFQCSQNEAFVKQVEILNEKRDKLLSQ